MACLLSSLQLSKPHPQSHAHGMVTVRYVDMGGSIKLLAMLELHSSVQITMLLNVDVMLTLSDLHSLGPQLKHTALCALLKVNFSPQ